MLTVPGMACVDGSLLIFSLSTFHHVLRMPKTIPPCSSPSVALNPSPWMSECISRTFTRKSASTCLSELFRKAHNFHTLWKGNTLGIFSSYLKLSLSLSLPLTDRHPVSLSLSCMCIVFNNTDHPKTLTSYRLFCQCLSFCLTAFPTHFLQRLLLTPAPSPSVVRCLLWSNHWRWKLLYISCLRSCKYIYIYISRVFFYSFIDEKLHFGFCVL